MIHTRCPECGERLSFGHEACGATVPCRSCRQPVTVPTSSVAAGPEAAREAPAYEAHAEPEPQPRPQAPSWIKLVAGCLAFSLAAVGLSFLFAGSFWVLLPSMLGVVLSGILLFYSLWALIKSTFESGYDRVGLLALCGFWAYFLATFGLCLLITKYFAVAAIYIENATARPVRLLLGGKEWVLVPAKGNAWSSLRMGSYEVEVKSAEDGSALDQMSVTVEDGKPWILNVMGAQVFARGRVDYGGFSFGSGPSESRLTGKWIKADVDHLFEEPPKSITVSTRRGQMATGSRTYIRRGEPKKE